MEEHLTFAKERSFKRKLMKAQIQISGDRVHGASNEDGCQTRKLHIVYFLSRNGNIEPPHLIRIHHLSHNGVRLRDVKSWLSELRGKDMPERFAWSYKRKYKGGYVWQDLLDDDLITPICDNEYVLKGSEISSTALNNDMHPYNEDEEVFELKRPPSFEVNAKDPKYTNQPDFSINTSIEKEESSFGSNITTEDATKNQDEEVVQSQMDNNENNPFHETSLNKNPNANNNKRNNKNKKRGNKSVSGYCIKLPPSPTSSSFGKSSRSSGSRASNMFRNWITCGTANTNEKVVVVINHRKGDRTSAVSLVAEKIDKENNMGQIYKERNFRGYEKSFEGRNESKKSKTKEGSNNLKTHGAAYKPVNGPNCSQCGRQFNPEKFHSHMKYCRGLKTSAKSTTPISTPTIPKTSTTTFSPSSPSLETTFYLTNN